MQKLQTVHGAAIPLDRADVDTDQIIPAQHLKRVERSGFGRFAFERWRADPAFVLNLPRLRGAPILVAGANFGCGSSREHAPWALEDLGIRVIVAPSFGDIFRNNCVNVGILTVTLPESEWREVLDAASSSDAPPMTVNLEAQTLAIGEIALRFDVDAHAKHRLLNGLDAIGLTEAHDDAIATHERRRDPLLPTTDRFRGPETHA